MVKALGDRAPTLAVPSSQPPGVAGWDTARPAARGGLVTVAEALVEMLRAVGVEETFGIVGGGIAPVADAIQRSPLRLWHTRHEAGAAFSAVEASFATGRPAAVFVTTGPGLTNVLTGLFAARWDGARVLLLSASTTPAHRGRFSVQETSAFTMPQALYEAGSLFDLALVLSDPAELPEVQRRLAVGFARPQGFVAHVAIPLNLQTIQIPAPGPPPDISVLGPTAPASAIARCAELLSSQPSMIWVGHGARHASRSIVAVAERLGAPVVSSPRAKGVFPEDHPLYLGVTGAGGHASVHAFLRAHRPAHTLVLGTRLGEVTSFWHPALQPSDSFIHVDLDATAFGAAYRGVPTLGVQAEIGELCEGLVEALPEKASGYPTPIPGLDPPPRLEPRPGPVRPQFLLQAVQRVVIDGSDAVVMTESGNSFGWGNHLLRFRRPGRYRTSAAFGSMGHFVTGVVGAALARRGTAVALVGDGAMLMNNEVSTAVRYGAHAVWIVLDDSRYGITHQAMGAQGFEPVETLLPATDFAALARSMGARGINANGEDDVVPALERAMSSAGPVVVDVRIDPDEVGPVLAERIRTLEAQGARGSSRRPSGAPGRSR